MDCRSWVMRHLFFAMVAIVGCRTKGEPTLGDTAVPVTTTRADADGDGYFSPEDCNDDSPLIHPGASELCDGIDNNCDGNVDEGVTTTFYEDLDGDGTPNAVDCDPADPTKHKGAIEICNGDDDDCEHGIVAN